MTSASGVGYLLVQRPVIGMTGREHTISGMSGHLCAITGQGDEFVDQP
jgi:hypothetical protein